MKTYVDEYFYNLNGPERRSVAEKYGLEFGKMGGNLMVVLTCGGNVFDAGLMSYRNFLLSLQTKKLIVNPCRRASICGSLQVWSDCDNDTLVFEYIPSSLIDGKMPASMFDDDAFDLAPDLLVPAVVYNKKSGRVLMIGATCRETIEITKSKGLATFYSRTKAAIWTKGETSGNLIEVSSIRYNKLGDGAVMYETYSKPDAVCHNGNSTCFLYNDRLTKLFG